jgi:hypothetical protein
MVRLEHLEIHVNQCGFAPVMCENEGCGAIVNKRDQENHEKIFANLESPNVMTVQTLKQVKMR